MPAPQATMMQQLAKAQFMSFGIKLPVDWKQPQGEGGRQYGNAFKPSEHVGVVTPPTLFVPASTNKYHTDTVNKISGQFNDYIDGICSAICDAWSQWQTAATMVGVMITGPVASMGQVVGIPWLPLIMASGPKTTPAELKYTTTIANVLNTAWLAYTATIKVPGLPWYPAFAAVPSPVAPPMPNVPVPVVALTQVTVPVSKAILKGQMIAMHADPTAQHSVELFDAVADAFEKCFQLWQTTTMVTNVLGTGPVPTFAPPVVPVGPVLGGIGSMTPGGFT